MNFPMKQILDTKYIKVFDIEFQEGKHYYDVSRRDEADLIVNKSADEIKELVPDAVCCEVVLERAGKEPVILLAYEYRYPIGQYLLSPTAGLIDPEDKVLDKDAAIRNTAIRELKEETGITFKAGDCIDVISPLLLSTPGMTDENNALVRITIHNADISELSQAGCEGPEQFNGFEMLTPDEARRMLDQGMDDNGMVYSAYTWMVLADFVRRYGEKR